MSFLFFLLLLDSYSCACDAFGAFVLDGGSGLLGVVCACAVV